jgi:hypothetical protein
MEKPFCGLNFFDLSLNLKNRPVSGDSSDKLQFVRQKGCPVTSCQKAQHAAHAAMSGHGS